MISDKKVDLCKHLPMSTQSIGKKISDKMYLFSICFRKIVELSN